MRWISLALALVAFSGCAAPIQATRNPPQPMSLAEVNALLDGERVTIELAGGTQITDVRNARVEPGRLTFTVWSRDPNGPRRSLTTLPIGDVVRITTVEGRGVRSGAWIGAAPGLLTIGAGAGIAAGAAQSGYSEGDVLVGSAVALLGVVAVVTGAVIGGVGASHVRPGRRVTIYQSPIGRSLPPGAAPPDR